MRKLILMFVCAFLIVVSGFLVSCGSGTNSSEAQKTTKSMDLGTFKPATTFKEANTFGGDKEVGVLMTLLDDATINVIDLRWKREFVDGSESATVDFSLKYDKGNEMLYLSCDGPEKNAKLQKGISIDAVKQFISQTDVNWFNIGEFQTEFKR